MEASHALITVKGCLAGSGPKHVVQVPEGYRSKSPFLNRIQTPFEPTVWVSESREEQPSSLAEIDQTRDRTGQDPSSDGPLLSISPREDRVGDQVPACPPKRPTPVTFQRMQTGRS